MRARGFGGVPLESRELMLASDFLRGGAAVGGLFGPQTRACARALISPSLRGAATPGSGHRELGLGRAPNAVRETSVRRPCRSSVAAA